jgi:hypothetical protein
MENTTKTTSDLLLQGYFKSRENKCDEIVIFSLSSPHLPRFLNSPAVFVMTLSWNYKLMPWYNLVKSIPTEERLGWPNPKKGLEKNGCTSRRSTAG